MVFIANQNINYELWDYILGNPKMSIATDRYYYLDKLNHEQKIKIALMDRDNNHWTKWGEFPGPLLSNRHNGVAVDVHRSMMPNEIVIESDYPDYIDNFEASKIVGKILEGKGFIPHYYYSGNKSIHCLPTKTQVFIKTRLGIRKTPIEEIERLLRYKQSVEIMSPNGFVKVKNAIRRKQIDNEKLVRIYTRNGKKIDMSQDHLQLVNRKNSITIIKAKDILSTDRIPYTLKKFEGEGGNFKLGRFLGWFLAEGCVRDGTFQFTIHKDEEHICSFITRLGKEYGSRVMIIREDNCIRINFVCRTLEAFVNDFSIGKTAKGKGIKSSAYGMSTEFRKGILDGWFEGDGDHATKNNRVTVSSGLAKSIEYLCTSLGIRVSRHSYIGKDGYSNKNIRFYRLRKINKRHGLSTISTKPNFPCAFDTIKYINKSFSKKTDLIDIEVDSTDNLFCLANGIITHNCHIFLDWKCLNTMYWDKIENKAKTVGSKIDYNIEKFKQDFIIWLRTKMINCWDTKVREFDKDLIKATHLIRCELSKNKKGFKTFLGYTHNDLSFIPYVCNEDNRIYPRLGKIIKSNPHCINELLNDYFADKAKVKPVPTSYFNPADCPDEVRHAVGRLLSDDFREMTDGKSRAMFIIVSELRRVMGDDEARPLVNDWNARMGNKIKQSEIDYRFTKKAYTLSNKYINDFMEEIGMK